MDTKEIDLNQSTKYDNNPKYAIARKNNRRLFPSYKMFSWDLLFYYAIIFLFLTIEKGLSPSEVLLVDAFYPLFRCILNIPSLIVSDKIGKRNSIILGNMCNAIAIFIMILSQSIYHIIIANFFLGLGFSLKYMCEECLLRECIEPGSNANNYFAKINSKGLAYYFIFDAISTASTGFLFVFNPYLPMYVCLFMCIFSVIISSQFDEYTDNKHNTESFDATYISDVFSAFKFIFSSRRLRALLLFAGFFAGLLHIRYTTASSLFAELAIPKQYFGLIFAGLQLFSCFSSMKQNYFHKKYGNKLLTHFSLKYILSMLLIGIIATLNFPFTIKIICIFLLYGFIHIIKGSYYVMITRYFQSFSGPDLNTKISMVEVMFESLMGAVMSFFASFLLARTTTAYTIIIAAFTMFIVFIFILNYMQKRLGLKPEEYDKRDIEFKKASEIKNTETN